MKQFIITLLSGALMLCFAACSDNGSSKSTDTEDSDSNSDSTSTATTDDPIDSATDTHTGNNTSDTASHQTDTGMVEDTSDASTDSEVTADSDSVEDTEMTPAMQTCIGEMQAMGETCQWDESRLSDVPSQCENIAMLGEDVVTALFECATEMECATFDNDATAEQAMATCITSIETDVTAEEAADLICTYESTCMQDETAILPQQQVYNLCVEMLGAELANYPAAFFPLLVSCVPETTTCSETEVATYEACMDR